MSIGRLRHLDWIGAHEASNSEMGDESIFESSLIIHAKNETVARMFDTFRLQTQIQVANMKYRRYAMFTGVRYGHFSSEP